MSAVLCTFNVVIWKQSGSDLSDNRKINNMNNTSESIGSSQFCGNNYINDISDTRDTNHISDRRQCNISNSRPSTGEAPPIGKISPFRKVVVFS